VVVVRLVLRPILGISLMIIGAKLLKRASELNKPVVDELSGSVSYEGGEVEGLAGSILFALGLVYTIYCLMPYYREICEFLFAP